MIQFTIKKPRKRVPPPTPVICPCCPWEMADYRFHFQTFYTKNFQHRPLDCDSRRTIHICLKRHIVCYNIPLQPVRFHGRYEIDGFILRSFMVQICVQLTTLMHLLDLEKHIQIFALLVKDTIASDPGDMFSTCIRR